MLYGTTDKFLRVFGLNSLADLPETEALDVAAKVEGKPLEEDKSQLTIDTAGPDAPDAPAPDPDRKEDT
jgi:hypothetical protein